MRRDILAKDVANREHLYSEFLKEVGNLYFDSVNRTLDDTSQQASLITMYSLVGRIRMISSEAVLTSAEKVVEDIVESYKCPPTTFQEFQQSWEASNPWHEFTKACRADHLVGQRDKALLAALAYTSPGIGAELQETADFSTAPRHSLLSDLPKGP